MHIFRRRQKQLQSLNKKNYNYNGVVEGSYE